MKRNFVFLRIIFIGIFVISVHSCDFLFGQDVVATIKGEPTYPTDVKVYTMGRGHYGLSDSFFLQCKYNKTVDLYYKIGNYDVDYYSRHSSLDSFVAGKCSYLKFCTDYKMTCVVGGEKEEVFSVFFVIDPNALNYYTKITYDSESETFSWDKIEGATSYRIYRYNPSPTGYDTLQITTTNTSCSTSGLATDKSYCVYAVFPSEKELCLTEPYLLD